MGDADELSLRQLALDEVLDETLTCWTEPSHRRLSTQVLEAEGQTVRREAAIEHERRGPTDLTLPTYAATLLLFVRLVPPTILVHHMMNWMAEADLHGFAWPDALKADGTAQTDACFLLSSHAWLNPAELLEAGRCA